MNVISNTTSVRLFLVIPMAEGVACVDGNGSFDNQTDEAAPTEYESIFKTGYQGCCIDMETELKKRPEVSLHKESTRSDC